jgi:putative SOS response-associated peptidase YedK
MAIFLRSSLSALVSQSLPISISTTAPGPHQVYGFLTTSPNAIVEPNHPKAMPVILTTDEARCLDARTMGRSKGVAATVTG